jgi:predicted permease
VSYQSNYSYRAYVTLASHVDPDTEIFGFNFVPNVVVSIDEQPSMVVGGAVADGRYFSVLRVSMALGRPITALDDQPGAPLVAVISHRFWRRAFGGDPSAVGRMVTVNGSRAEIVGVSAPMFTGLTKGGFFAQPDITLPLRSFPFVSGRMAMRDRLFTDETIFWVRVMARVRHDAARDRLEQALTPLFRRHLPPAALEDARPPAIRLLPGGRGHEVVAADTRRMLLLLSGVSALVLLIACANLAGLILARGASRLRELNVRRALGAGRFELVRLVMVESLVLAFAGTTVGVIAAVWSRDGLAALFTAGAGGAARPVPVDVTLDVPLLVAAAGAACVTAAVIAAIPALLLTRSRVVGDLNARIGSAPRLGAGRVLMALQIGGSMPLVAGAALLLETMANLSAVELGFEARDVVIFRFDPAVADPDAARQVKISLDVLARLGAIPGVDAATIVENPLAGGLTSGTSIAVDGVSRRILMNAVGPGFIETMGMRLIGGRQIAASDVPGAARVAMVNESAVRIIFGGAWPVGRRIGFGRSEIEIVGVVSDTRYRDRRSDVEPILFDSALQRPGYGGHHLALRTAASPASLEVPIRQALASVNTRLPLPDLRTQTAEIAETSARERVFAQVLTVFSGFALLLAAIGLYGLTAYAVARRTAEIGLRVALGSRPAQVLWLFVRQVAWLTAAGLALGIPLALGAGRLVSAFLFGVSPDDAVSIGAAAFVLVLVSLAACVVPARRAATLDPLVALRAE